MPTRFVNPNVHLTAAQCQIIEEFIGRIVCILAKNPSTLVEWSSPCSEVRMRMFITCVVLYMRPDLGYTRNGVNDPKGSPTDAQLIRGESCADLFRWLGVLYAPNCLITKNDPHHINSVLTKTTRAEIIDGIPSLYDNNFTQVRLDLLWLLGEEWYAAFLRVGNDYMDLNTVIRALFMVVYGPALQFKQLLENVSQTGTDPMWEYINHFPSLMSYDMYTTYTFPSSTTNSYDQLLNVFFPQFAPLLHTLKNIKHRPVITLDDLTW